MCYCMQHLLASKTANWYKRIKIRKTVLLLAQVIYHEGKQLSYVKQPKPQQK